MKYQTIEDTVYFWFASNDTSGSGGDGATPVFDVRLAGAAAGAIPTLSGSATLLSHANYPAGCHEIAIAATSANGFSAAAEYAVFCTLLVDSQNPSGFVGNFGLYPVISNMTEIGGGAQSMTDLKDFADAGYNPATNKVTGVLLTDTCTTNTDMVGTAGANTTVPDAAGTAATLIGNLNDFDPANDDVAVVTLVNTTTTNSDMVGTAGANTTVPDAAGTAATLHGITDGKVDSVQTDTTAIVADTGTDGVVVAAASKTGYALSAAGIDGILDEVVEGSITLRQATSLFLAVLTGKTSGGGTTTLTFRDTGDSKNRLVVTVDGSNNRTAVGTRDGA